MIIDIVTVVFLFVLVFWGTKRGAMKMIISAASFVVSVILGIEL